MKYRWAAVVCAAVLGGIAMPARADVSALYEVAQSDEEFDDFEQAIDFAMTIEVNDAGNARIHLTGRSSYFLIRDDEVYSVRRGIDGPYAEKLDDLEAVIENAGETGGISLELLDQFPKIELVRKGKVRVGQWTGTGYAQRDFDGAVGRPELVLSKDETLAEVGKAFARLADGRFGSIRTLSLVNLFGGFGLYDPEIRKLLQDGTPVRINMLELAEISNRPIDPDRFELPARVLTREEIEQQNKPFEWSPAFDRQPKG